MFSTAWATAAEAAAVVGHDDRPRLVAKEGGASMCNGEDFGNKKVTKEDNNKAPRSVLKEAYEWAVEERVAACLSS